MWNDHLFDRPNVADRHVRDSLLDFIDKFAAEVRQKTLHKNFVLHVCNLHDFGLLSAPEVSEVVERMQNAVAADLGGDEATAASIDLQRTETNCPEKLPSELVGSSTPLKAVKSPSLPVEHLAEDGEVSWHVRPTGEDLESGIQKTKRPSGASGSSTPVKAGKASWLLEIQEDEEVSLHLHLTDSSINSEPGKLETPAPFGPLGSSTPEKACEAKQLFELQEDEEVSLHLHLTDSSIESELGNLEAPLQLQEDEEVSLHLHLTDSSIDTELDNFPSGLNASEMQEQDDEESFHLHLTDSGEESGQVTLQCCSLRHV